MTDCLRDFQTDMADDREIHTEAGLTLAASEGIEFFETSALTGENVTDLFIRVAELLHKNGPRKTVPNVANVNFDNSWEVITLEDYRSKRSNASLNREARGKQGKRGCC